MENNVVCKAKIKSKCLVLIIIYVIIVALAVIFGIKTQSDTIYEPNFAASLNNRVKGNYKLEYKYDKAPQYRIDEYYLWGEHFATNTYDVREDLNLKEGMSWYLNWDRHKFLIIMGCVIIILPITIIIFFKVKARKSKLELTDEGIDAVNKKLFSTENIKLPIDKVENAFVKKNLYNILTGGKTIVICTRSGKYKFPWVQNADEFVDAALAKMKS